MLRLIPWLALTLLVAAAPAAAQEATAEMLDAEARARFELAMVHIQNGRFEDAAHEFHRAWELSHRDALLYNEFLAWRDGGFSAQAGDALEAYLGTLEGDDPSRPNLEARLRVLREQGAAADAAAEGGPAEDDPAPTAPPPAASTSPHPIGFALIGVGAAVAIVGAITGGMALSISDGLAADCAGGVCPESRRGDLDTGPALALATDILLPLGVVTAAVGVVLALTVTESNEAPRAALACDGTSCVAAVGGAF